MNQEPDLRVCSTCKTRGDWRGIQSHHVIHRGMGGRKGKAKVLNDDESNRRLLCGRCHSAEHGIREV